METSLSSFSWAEKRRLEQIRKPIMKRYGNDANSVTKNIEVVIPVTCELVRQKLAEAPNDALLWYWLGDLYSSIHEFAKALEANRRCYELEPTNPRAIYGLASAYSNLSWANFVIDEFDPRYKHVLKNTGRLIDPVRSQLEIAKLEITAEEAGQQAINLFNRLLTMNLDVHEQEHVEYVLVGLRLRFPHLNAQGQQRKNATKMADEVPKEFQLRPTIDTAHQDFGCWNAAIAAIFIILAAITIFYWPWFFAFLIVGYFTWLLTRAVGGYGYPFVFWPITTGLVMYIAFYWPWLILLYVVAVLAIVLPLRKRNLNRR